MQYSYISTQPGTYKMRLRGRIGEAVSEWVESGAAAIDSQQFYSAPSAPTLNLPSRSGFSISLSWSNPAETLDRVVLYAKLGASGWQEVRRFENGETSLTFTPPASGAWAFRMNAVYGGGISDYSTEQSITVPTVNAPTNLSASNPSGSLVSLSWTAPTEEHDGYYVDVRKGTNAWSSLKIGTGTSFEFNVGSAGTWDIRLRATFGPEISAPTGEQQLVIS